MKKKQNPPAAGREKCGHKSRRFRSSVKLIMMGILLFHQTMNGYGQIPAISNGYLLKVSEDMGSFSYVNSLIYDDSVNIGIGTMAPEEKLDVSGGNIRTSGSYISTAPQGIAPITVQSSTLAPNLNSDLIDGQHAAAFAPSVHNHSPISNGTGILPFNYAGDTSVVIAVNFDGNGSALQASRSDHAHSGSLLGAGAATQVAFFNGPSTVTGSPSLFWDSNGNRLGIGTQTPLASLHINTNGTASGIRLSETHINQFSGLVSSAWGIQNAAGTLKFDVLNNGTLTNVCQFTSSGSVTKLSMNGTISAKVLQLTQGYTPNYILSTNTSGMVYCKDPALVSGWTVLGNNVYKTNGVASVGTTNTDGVLNIKSAGQPAVIVETGSSGGYGLLMKAHVTQCKAFSVERNGTEQLVIWGDGLMQVDNKIKAKEVEVTLSVWQDAVFEKGYPLLSLDNVEKYINQHHHLPDIPSEEEVLQEGIALGEMNSLLLKKIEELTLYLIEMNKVNTALQDKIAQLSVSPKP